MWAMSAWRIDITPGDPPTPARRVGGARRGRYRRRGEQEQEGGGMAHAREVWGKARSAARAQWYLRSATEVARTVRLRGRPVVKNAGTMRVGDRVQLVSDVATLELATGADGTLEIGARSFVNYGTSISASLEVVIGPRCQIGTYCLIMDNDFHRVEPERRLERPDSVPVVLGENVWLGGRVIVLPGATIGDHSVIGAGSVVTGPIPARCVAAGVPARVLREL
jgi:maltose O-acetyltransferase